MVKKVVLLFCCTLALSSCNQKKSENKEVQPNIAEEKIPHFTSESEGIGPVDLAESNFFYAGELVINNNESSLKVCATGVKLPIVNSKGVFDALHQRYTEVFPASRSVFVMIRGYQAPHPTDSNLPDSLVVTYLTDMQANVVCAPNSNILGTYTAQYTDKYITLAIYPNYKYSFKTLDGNNRSVINELKGNWELLGMNNLMISYITKEDMLAPNADINYADQTISWVTQNGQKIILEKDK